MAAWINSGVDTQGGTKTSTMREEQEKISDEVST